ncbi:MAG: biotin--[acetyl-CoA-carboxylase] ligase [Candidatus Marinimicrobia bacterium]|nr:biotin--[acetyl-CoA-carboxylase] ligase [Candidatus Neomarinimicrobiota bacterium]
MLDLERIAKLLTTRELGRSISYYPFTDSTNDDLWELLDQGLAEPGHVVVTDDQRYGRGRKGRRWYSTPGKSVPFSILLMPEIDVKQLGLISLAAGVALADGLRSFGIPAGLKWPNDVLVSRRKLGGILIESRLADEGPIVVAGVGVNVNESREDFPKKLRPAVTSALIEKGEALERELVLARVLDRLEEILAGDLAAVPQLWLERCEHLGHKMGFYDDGEQLQGKFTGIDDQGHGLVQRGKRTYVVTAGDLEWPEA